MGMFPGTKNPDYESSAETFARWEEEEEKKRKAGGFKGGGGKGSSGWRITLPPDEEGRTAGPLAMRQAMSNMAFEQLMRYGVGNVDLDRDKQNRATQDRVLAAASARNMVINDEKVSKDKLIRMQRDLFLTGQKPNNDQQEQLWKLQDEYEKAAKKKAFFLAQHPEGDTISF